MFTRYICMANTKNPSVFVPLFLFQSVCSIVDLLSDSQAELFQISTSRFWLCIYYMVVAPYPPWNTIPSGMEYTFHLTV